MTFWERFFTKKYIKSFKKTPYFSGDMGFMIIILKHLKIWSSRVKIQKEKGTNM